MLEKPQLYVPLAGAYGPTFDDRGTPVPASVGRWELHPGALLLVVIFLGFLAYKAAR